MIQKDKFFYGEKEPSEETPEQKIDDNFIKQKEPEEDKTFITYKFNLDKSAQELFKFLIDYTNAKNAGEVLGRALAFYKNSLIKQYNEKHQIKNDEQEINKILIPKDLKKQIDFISSNTNNEDTEKTLKTIISFCENMVMLYKTNYGFKHAVVNTNENVPDNKKIIEVFNKPFKK